MTGKVTGILAGRVGNVSRFGFVLLTQQEKNSYFRLANQSLCQGGSSPAPPHWNRAGAPTLLTSQTPGAAGRWCTRRACLGGWCHPSPTFFQRSHNCKSCSVSLPGHVSAHTRASPGPAQPRRFVVTYALPSLAWDSNLTRKLQGDLKKSPAEAGGRAARPMIPSKAPRDAGAAVL